MEPRTLLPKVLDHLLDTVCVVDEEGRYVFVNAACERLLGYKQDELIGRNMIDLVFPADRKRTLEAAAEIMSGQPKMHFENRYVRKDGELVHIMWSARWLEDERIRLAVARDATAFRRTARLQSALYQISEAAHAADGLLGLYRHIHKIVGELLPAENFSVALYDSASDTLSYPYIVDERVQALDAHPLRAGTPIAEVLRTGEALLLTREGSGDEADTTSAAGGGWLGVPLVSQTGVMGALVVQAYTGSVRYTQDDKDLLQFVSIQVAAAIERKQTETRLHHMARHDPLTDLPNRTLFHDRFDMALKRARRYKERLALLYLDLDGFKEVNDTFGHEFGDRLLCDVARRLGQCVRESDTIGRVGGDEFSVLLAKIHEPRCADIMIEKIRTAIEAPFELDGHTLAVSVSVGAAIYPEHGGDQEKLFRHADASMYAAKRRES